MRPRLPFLMLAVAATVSLPLSPAKAGPVKTASSGAGCEPRWEVVPTPFDPQVGSTLGGVDGASSDDVWATGTYTGAMDGGDSLAMHWDGAAWTEVQTPPLEGQVSLGPVTAISANDVWAVGSHNQTGLEGLLEHWDGSRWTADTLADMSLGSVDAVSSEDVWAVGARLGDPSRTLALHFDGDRWRAVDTPSPGGGWSSGLSGVDAISSDDVWAVGSAHNADLTRTKLLSLHWDGSSWRSVPLPPVPDSVSFQGVSGVSPTDVWAVGHAQGYGPFAMHWDGVRWARSGLPGESGVPEGLAAAASNDVWTVGWYWNANRSTDTGFAMHWDGSTWTRENLPHAGSSHNYVYDVAAISSSDVWAVGNADDFGRPLALHRTAVCPV